MARKWDEIIEEEVTGARLNKTGKGFDNISNVEYDSEERISEFDADGWHYVLIYNTEGNLSKVEEYDGAVLNQDWVVNYNVAGLFTGTTNTIY